jgi:3-hydroxybutyryl-CoA dehydrogenase
MRSMRAVGVIGAGVMGAGVAQALSQSGLEVVLVDIADDVLAGAMGRIRDGLRQSRLLQGARPGERTADVLARVTPTTELRLVERVDFVIENVTEDEGVKRQVHGQLDAACPPRCVFAANTSAIPITRIASWTGRPDRVIGMHFMNPAPLKPLVEVVRGHHTSDDTVQAAEDLLAAMGKECVVVADSPGFVSNRVLMLTINEAAFLVQERVAEAAEIDRIFKGCFGHQMGPLETADLIGLDTIVRSIKVLYESFNDGKYRPCPLLRQMVDAGLHGRKTGQGFYRYGNARPRSKEEWNGGRQASDPGLPGPIPRTRRVP